MHPQCQHRRDSSAPISTWSVDINKIIFITQLLLRSDALRTSRSDTRRRRGRRKRKRRGRRKVGEEEEETTKEMTYI